MLFSAPQSEPEAATNEMPLADMTVAELREMAHNMGIAGYSTMIKNNLIAAIEAAKDKKDENQG